MLVFVGHFYIAPFSALKQTYCTLVACNSVAVAGDCSLSGTL